MKTPKTTTAAMNSGNWLLTNVRYKGDKKCRVEFRSRFHRPDKKNIIQFWISSTFFKSKWPETFDSFGY